MSEGLPTSRRKLNEEARGVSRGCGEYKMSNAVEVNDADFETQIEQHKGLAVVDFGDLVRTVPHGSACSRPARC